MNEDKKKTRRPSCDLQGREKKSKCPEKKKGWGPSTGGKQAKKKRLEFTEPKVFKRSTESGVRVLKGQRVGKRSTKKMFVHRGGEGRPEWERDNGKQTKAKRGKN